ncbi:hypothetical protein KCP78_14280 [Salmonella enterica subsp. enterica]|nr:hypothetical protein KCP78_14280 [Salmonella enterica subsp. enterica]
MNTWRIKFERVDDKADEQPRCSSLQTCARRVKFTAGRRARQPALTV